MENERQNDFSGYVHRVESFHGSAAPGVLVGYFMVEAARAELSPGILFEAICETRVCLPDAIQLLTPCTLGNGRLKVLHVGRFAITLYDKHTGEGARAFLDASLLEQWPDIRDWFFKLKSKAEQDSALLNEQIRKAGRSIIGVRSVAVRDSFLKKSKLGPIHLCASCGEAFPKSSGAVCGGCLGELPYQDASGNS